MPMSMNVGQSNSWDSRSVAARRVPGIGGLGIVVGAVAYVIHVVARSMLTAGVDPVASARADLWVPVNALGAVGAALALLGLPALATRLAGADERSGQLGLALIGASWLFFGVFLSLYGAIVLPWLADQAPELLSSGSSTPVAFVIAFALGLLAWLAGAALLAIPFLKGETRPRWIGFLLPGSALWFLIGSFVVAPDGPADNLAVNLLSNLGTVLLLIALGYLGFRAWDDAESE